jgi:hypothetical protein
MKNLTIGKRQPQVRRYYFDYSLFECLYFYAIGFDPTSGFIFGQ